MSAVAEFEASAQRERELRKVVLAWLSKKGYTRAEEQFRREAEIAGKTPARDSQYPLGPRTAIDWVEVLGANLPSACSRVHLSSRSIVCHNFYVCHNFCGTPLGQHARPALMT